MLTSGRHPSLRPRLAREPRHGARARVRRSCDGAVRGLRRTQGRVDGGLLAAAVPQVSVVFCVLAGVVEGDVRMDFPRRRLRFFSSASLGGRLLLASRLGKRELPPKGCPIASTLIVCWRMDNPSSSLSSCLPRASEMDWEARHVLIFSMVALLAAHLG